MSRYADKRSFDYCKETCPEVSRVVGDFLDGEFDKFIEKVKEVSSYKMREALTSACSDLIAAESEIEDLKRQLAQKDNEIHDLRRQVRDLEREAA